jgi:hypothetical protein
MSGDKLTQIAGDIARIEKDSQPAPDKIHELRNELLQLQSIEAESLSLLPSSCYVRRSTLLKSLPSLSAMSTTCNSQPYFHQGLNHPAQLIGLPNLATLIFLCNSKCCRRANRNEGCHA